ncbi:tyrosine-type recombinase/integrase [Fictibacillus barbaricus]|uniref:Integrase n=1 Tax=Fictibacillus barbaricus TaxID=182136 RepID=A0ABU1U3X1_9BACL|nr:site-specific integrase [Fictibacillus barbaricus]MDR7074148.1 integrase [Fictibacillus barbaricus]
MRGSIKKNGNSWYYVLDLGKDEKGLRKQKKKRGFKTKKEAEKALVEAINAINKGTYIEPTKMTYKDYLEKWFNTKKNSIGTQSVVVYENCLRKRIKPKLGHITLSKLSSIHIQSFIDNLYDEGLSSCTIKKYFEIIRNSLEHAVDFSLINKNVAVKVKLPKTNNSEMKVWNNEEVNQFLKVAKGDFCYIVFKLALATGLRQGEILGLRWKDVDLEKGSLYIKQTLSHDGKSFKQGAKTKSSKRTVDLSKSAIKALKEHNLLIEKEKETLGPIYQDFDLVACTHHGSPHNASNIRRSFNRLIKLAKVPKIRFHDLRHTHATLLLSKGVNIKVISERLGHSNIKVTLDTYSHVLPTMQEEAVRKIDEIFE